jgi:molybdopterin-guanine dinucleotide biosynthesis protein A
MGVSGVVLAGGRSRRLGTDKRRVLVEGRPLLARAVAAVRAVASDLHVVVATPNDNDLVADLLGGGGRDVAVHTDVRPGCGPAAGLEVALSVARHELVLVVATDHPVLRPEVLALLVKRAAASAALAVALEGPYGGEPLLAVYRTAALGPVRTQLDAGTRRMQDILTTLDPDIIGSSDWQRFDPSGETLRDIDVPSDLER